MAIYHLSVKIFSRGKGASAVAKAAYRAAECITSEYDGRVNNYTKKSGVIHSEILLPENAPREYFNRAVLWNSVEKAERYKTAQLAREIEVALPKELCFQENLKLVHNYVKHNFVDEGMCADFSIHDKGDGNPHAHIMLTMRSLDESGKWLPKSHTVDGVKMPTNDWSNRANCEVWRENWSNAVNAVLEQNNITERVDNRSFERQGIKQIPTVHLGVAAHQMEQRGIKTERGNINRKVEITNKELRQLKARIIKLENWIKEESKNPKPPTLYDIISDILNRKSGIYSLKSAANMLMFLTDNNISDMSDLENKVDSMHKRQSTLLGRLKPVERRLKTLDEHIKQAENYKKYRAVSRCYNELYSEYQSAQNATGLFAKGKAQKALDFANNYYESNRAELTLFNAAERYIEDVMQERYDPKKLPPITKWKAEFKSLSADKDLIYREYYSLKDEVKGVEKVRRQVEGILREDNERNLSMRKKREEYGLE